MTTALPIIARSIHRRPDCSIPEIVVSWSHPHSKKWRLQSSLLEEYPFFNIFNYNYLNTFQLPDGNIPHRYDTQVTLGTDIKKAISIAIEEIRASKKLSLFTVLKDSNFDYRYNRGMIILRYKKEPYIVKLFIESPKSLVHPFDKGIVPCFFFVCGGGINRHLAGMTRIGTRELVKEKLQQLPQWKDRVDLPRKWFWLPDNNRWITIESSSIGSKGYQKIEIPSLYAIITDEIKPQRVLSLMSSKDRKTAIALSNDLDTLIDAHIDNFMIEEGTGKLIIIDTEHFPSLVGLEKKQTFNSHTHWYCKLGVNCIKRLCRTKRQRRLDQKKIIRYRLTYKASSDAS